MTNRKLTKEGILKIKSYKRITTQIASKMNKTSITIDRWLKIDAPAHERITHPDFVDLVKELTNNELNLSKYIIQEN